MVLLLTPLNHFLAASCTFFSRMHRLAVKSGRGAGARVARGGKRKAGRLPPLRRGQLCANGKLVLCLLPHQSADWFGLDNFFLNKLNALG